LLLHCTPTCKRTKKNPKRKKVEKRPQRIYINDEGKTRHTSQKKKNKILLLPKKKKEKNVIKKQKIKNNKKKNYQKIIDFGLLIKTDKEMDKL